MSRNPMVRAMSLAVALVLLSSTAATAQIDDPFATPPPNLFKGVRTAIVTSALSDSAANETIDAVAEEAHGVIGGVSKRLWQGTLPTTRNVVIAARDLAEQGNNIVIINGGDSQSTVGSAGLFPNTVFVDLGQSRPCVTEDGRPDASGTCAGGSRGIPFNYSTIDFSIDEAAYLAGIVSAAASRNGRIGIISGLERCDECNAYIEGFTLGARSLKPTIDIELAYLSDDDRSAAFGASMAGKFFAEAFINVHQPDVLFPIAGAGTTGMIEAACEAGIVAIGSDIDISAAYPNLAECVYGSIAKDYDTAVRESIFGVANDTLPKEQIFDLSNRGVVLTDEWRQVPGLPIDLPGKFESAEQEILIGSLNTCPTQCPDRTRRVITTRPDASPSPEPDAPAEPLAEG